MVLLDLLGGKVEEKRLHQYLCIWTIDRKNPAYQFVPFKDGPYSFSLEADLRKMVEMGIIDKDGQNLSSTLNNNKEINVEDQMSLQEMLNNCRFLGEKDIRHYIFDKNPGYFVQFDNKEGLFSENDIQIARRAINISSRKVLITIGYEGRSIEGYFKNLIFNNVKLLVDVRNNPSSRKYGFSKSHLLRICNALGIDYLHLPEVGIISENRRNLESQKDYDNLFEEYKNTILTETKATQFRILELLTEHKKVALTCFEAKACECHRSHLAEAIRKLPGFEGSVLNIENYGKEESAINSSYLSSSIQEL